VLGKQRPLQRKRRGFANGLLVARLLPVAVYQASLHPAFN
jgi:hypothetical protein